MARLDGERIALWREYCLNAASIQRRIDQQLVEEHELPLSWYDCLTTLRELGGEVRVHELCNALNEVASSFSRRLDRMEDEGLVMREPAPLPDDRRAVTVSLTKDGRLAWRDANITFRRVVQQRFAALLSDAEIDSLYRVASKVETAPEQP